MISGQFSWVLRINIVVIALKILSKLVSLVSHLSFRSSTHYFKRYFLKKFDQKIKNHAFITIG
jgi:hypothetical protein